MFWGLTPALDLLSEFKIINSNLPDEINILIVGGSDCRHVLTTLARKYRKYKKVKLNFYLVDACVETIARQLLLLNIALQPQDGLGLDQKTKIFMELYGNTLVRPTVAKYLTNAANNLIKMITNYDYLKQMMSCATLNIKYKERDYMENLLKFWCSQEEFNIVDYWDRRLRKNLGVRYDSKIGAFDWDLHMRLYNAGANQICGQEYRNFRMSGVAFSWLESEVSKPNRSVVCAVWPNGEKWVHYGYLGDMETGPFVSFGLQCEDEKFLKSTHGQNSYRATDVTERNLKQIFYEILNQENYEHLTTNDLQLGPVVMKQEKLIVDVKGVDIIPKATRKCIELEDDIKFYSISVLDAMKYKEQYSKVFDMIYFSCGYLKYFDANLVRRVSKENALLLIENPIFVINNRKKELEEFAKQVQDKLGDINFDKIDYNCEKDAYIKFVINKNK